MDSSSTVFGTVSSLANAQNAADSNAYATFTEVTSGAGTDDYFGTVVVDSATDPNNAEVIDGQVATVAGSSGYVTTGSWSNPNGAGVITSVKIFVRANGTGSAKDDIELSYNLGSGTSDPMGGSGLPSGALVNYSFDITSDYGGTWDWTVINNLQATATVGTNGGTAYVDALWIQVTYTAVETMDITTTVSSTTASDVYYIELNYYTSGDTFDIFAYNGTGWTDIGDLTQTGSFTVFNTSLTPDEYNSGSPQIKFKDKTADGTTGYLYLEYERVHSYTGGNAPASNHYEMKLNHNFTGIPKYAASEVAEYTVHIKGYVTASENLHIYAYDYTSETYTLIKDNAFLTTNGWVNYTIPYNSISDSGEANIQFRDANTSRDDDTAYNFYLDYVSIQGDNNKFLPCFYCHA
ncbi:MAG: hypothetical protein KAJ55_11075, partial [Anaerolineales bacterium]|nr:hypothetical protein [Anaerolineales bacterium]